MNVWGKALGVFLFAFAVPAASAWGQALSGAKDIPSAEFPTIGDAVTSLNTNGTTGAGVIFTIANGITYNGALTISRPDILATAPAVFQAAAGGTVTLTAPAGTPVVTINGADNVTLRGLTVTAAGQIGVQIQAAATGITIDQCTINVSGDLMYAINVPDSGNNNFTLNRSTLAGSNGADCGFRLNYGQEANSSGWKFYNNFIYGFDVAGIFLNHPGGHDVFIGYDGGGWPMYEWVPGNGVAGAAYHNSILMATGATVSNAVYYNNPNGSILWRNNIYAQPSSNAASYCFCYANGTLDSNYNDFYRTGSTSLGYYGATRSTLGQWQVATGGKDTNSITGDPKFLSSSDLRIDLGSYCVGKALKGVLLPDPNVDRQGEARDSLAPDIGADENLAASPVSPLAAATYTVGPAKTYLTPSDAINDLVNYGIAGPVIFNVYAGTYDGVVIGPVTRALATNLITFQKALDAGGAVNLGPVSFAYTSYVTLQGFDSIAVTGGTAVSLTSSPHISLVQNSISSTNGPAISVAAGSNNASLSGNTVTATNGTALVVSASSTLSATNNTFTASDVDAITVNGGSTAVSLSQNTVTLTSKVAGKAGLAVASASNHDLSVARSTFNVSGSGTYAVSVTSTANNNLKIERSTLAGSAGADCGLRLDYGEEANSSGWKLYNNFVYGFDVAGIFFNQAGGHNIIIGYDVGGPIYQWVPGNGVTGEAYHNSILMDSGTARSDAVYYNNPNGSIVWRNNIYAQPSSNIASYCFYYANGTLNSNYNDFYHPSAKAGYFAAGRNDLAAWKTATAQDGNSKEVDPAFVSSVAPVVNLHLTAASGCVDVGVDVGIAVDWDGDSRPFLGVAGIADIGADEFEDTTPPGPIGGFTASATGPNSIKLNWTAGGNDGNVGKATQYDVRYRTDAPVTELNWATSTQATGEPAPDVFGTPQSMDVNGLAELTTHYFGIKARDAANLWSPLSTTSTTTLDGTAPSRITTLVVKASMLTSITLQWNAPSDNAGTTASYDIRYSLSPITTDAQFLAAAQATGVPPPQSAGIPQETTVTGLTTSQVYYFAIKAVDAAGNWSPLSNPNPSGSTDRTPPATVTVSLTGAKTKRSIEISWLAPGDDGMLGTATAYQVRYSTAGPIDTEAKWLAANIAANPPAVVAPGSPQTMNVTGLFASTTYWISVRAVDEAPNSNWSGISVSVTDATTANNPPASVAVDGQYRVDGTTAIIVGGATNESGVIFKGTPAVDPDGDPVRFEVEIQPIGTIFANVPTIWSTYAPGGSPVSITYTVPFDGHFHWQARAMDDAGGTTAWIQFGGNLETETDFFIDSKPPVTVIQTDGLYSASTYAGMIQGTTGDGGGSGVDTLSLSIQRTSDNLYWNGASWQVGQAWIPLVVAANWSYTFSPANGQTYKLRAFATDKAGWVETAVLTNFTYDTTEPNSTILTTGGLTNGTYGGVIKVSASDGTTGVQQVKITIHWSEADLYWDNVASAWGATPVWIPAALSGPTWNYNFAATLYQTYNLQSYAVDGAGNVETSLGDSTFTIGLSGPDSVVATSGWYRPTSWPGGITGSAVTTSVGAIVTKVELTLQRALDGFYWSGASWGPGLTWLVAVGTDAWTFGFMPVNGMAYSVQSRATDSFTDVETSYGSATFTYDSIVPTSTILTNGVYTESSWSGLVQGTAADTGSGVQKVDITVRRSSDGQYWDGTAWVGREAWLTASGTANWARGFPADVGQSYLATARAVDLAGNVQPNVGAIFSVVEGGGDRTGKDCALSASGTSNATFWALLVTLLLAAGLGARQLRRSGAPR